MGEREEPPDSHTDGTGDTKWPQKMGRRNGPRVQQESPFYFVCVKMYTSVGACRGQKRVLGPRELELQAVVSCPT